MAEAWAGDSVSASFDAKYYKGRAPFTITSGTTRVELPCRIANVVASVDYSENLDGVLSDYTLTVGHSRGSLEFVGQEQRKGYFMMPSGSKNLNWTLSGKLADGSVFTKDGTIENVQPATEYVRSHFWGTEDDGAWSMVFDGKLFWLTPHAEKEGFRIWEPENGVVQEIADFPEGYQAGKLPYVHCFYRDREIICPPFDANMMIGLDTKEKKIKRIEQSIFLGGKTSGIYFRKDSYVFVRFDMGKKAGMPRLEGIFM